MSCPYKLRSAVWEITLACCFSCKYCGSSGGKARDNELTTEECLDLAKQLSELGCRRVSLIGGEVFMRKDWKQIIKALTDRNVRVAVITNGFLFTDEIIKDLKEVNVESVAVSLDGPKEIHNKYRQKGSFERAYEAIRTLTSNDIVTTVITTLNSENVQYIESFYNILAGLGISAWQIQACSPMGNAANSGIDYSFSARRVIDFVNKYRDKADFAIGIADNIGYRPDEDGDFLRGTPGRRFSGCNGGISSIGIDSIGNIRGCESMYDDKFIEGNIRKRSLKSIWEDENSFSYNRKFTADMLTGVCADCRYGKFCAGGCRSYNFFTHGKLYESLMCVRREENLNN